MVVGWGFGIGGSNGAISGSLKFKMAAGRTAAIFENSNGDISATGHLIHIMFCFYRVGFSRSACRVLLHPVALNPRGGRWPSWKISNEYVS